MIWAVVVSMMAIGMVLLVAEVAIIPGFGVAGVSAIALLIGGVVVCWWYYGASWGIGSLLIAAVLTVGVIALLPRTMAGRSLVLSSSITDQHSAGELNWLLGQTGKAITMLRPAGAAEIAGRRVDVVTDGQFVDPGTPIKVIQVEGNRVLVAAEKPAA
jgi:membrane-bound serine protease (ClpP class)